MKKILSLIIIAVTFLQANAALSLGDVFDYGDIKCEVVIGYVNVIGLSDEAASKPGDIDITIPGVITYNGQTFAVSNIVDNAFKDKKQILTVDIQYGVQKIGASAFENCTWIQRLYIPSSVNDIWHWAFRNCERLKFVRCAIADPTSNEVNINNAAFPDNKDMYLSVARTNPDAVELYKNHGAFSQFKNIIFSPLFVHDFFDRSDYGKCSYSMCVSKHPTRNTPGELTITYVDGLENYSKFVPKGEFSDGLHTFRVTAIADNANVFTYDPDMFDYDPNYTRISHITSVDLSNCPYLKRIGNNAFNKSTNLTSVTLNEGLESIGEMAFGYTGITSIDLPSTANDVNYSFGFFCNNFKTIYVARDNKTYSSLNGMMYSKDKTTLLCCPWGTTGTLDERKFASELKTLASYCFAGNIEKLYIPFGVTSIQPYAFGGHCTKLTTVKIPSSAKLEKDFTMRSNTTLTDLYINYPVPPTVASDFFGKVANKAHLYVPQEAITAYQQAPVWKEWTQVLPGAYDLIDPCLLTRRFANGTTQYSDSYFTVTSQAPKTVNGKQYDGCARYVSQDVASSMSMARLRIPEYVSHNGKKYAVTSVGRYATSQASIKPASNSFEVDMSLNVDTIMQGAFMNQANLTKVTMSPTVKVVEPFAFFNSNKAIQVYVNNPVPPTAPVTAFSTDAYANGALFVPVGTYNAYSKATCWKEFAHILDDITGPAKGDVNGDGVIDISDVNILLNIVLGKDTASKYDGRADVTGDGSVDISDVNSCLNIVLGKGEAKG